MSGWRRKNVGNNKKVDVNGLLTSAISVGNLATVQELVHSHGLAHCGPWRGGFTLLCNAVKSGHIEIAKFLLQEGAETNSATNCVDTPLHYAAELTRRRRAKACLSAELIRLLLENHAHIDARNSQNKTPLHVAAEKGCLKNVQVLIENGANLNALDSKGKTPLLLVMPKESRSDAYFQPLNYAAEREEGNRKRIAKLLLKNGADASIKDADGLTALHLSVISEDEDLVSVFLKSGVYVDLRAEDGSTALHLAAKRYLDEIGDMLCKKHADVETRDKNGFTPLLCASNGESDLIRTLLDYGADVNAEANNGETALDLAISFIKTLEAEENREALREARRGDIMDAVKYGKLQEYLDYESSSGSSDIEDYIDENFDPDKFLSVQTLKEHLIKLEAAGFYVSEKNLGMINYGDSRYSDFKEKCEKEVSGMKNTELCPSLTVFDILANGKTPTYMRNESLMEELEECEDENFFKFPIYESLLMKNVKRSIPRLKLLNSGQTSLYNLVKTSNMLNGRKCLVVPAELLEHIVSYLRNCDLNSLICCNETLKRQVHK